MSGLEIINDATKRMEGSITSFKHSLNGLRTGRASASLIEPIKVEVWRDDVHVSGRNHKCS